MPQLLIKSENDARTHNIVDTYDADEIFASGKSIEVNDKPDKIKKVLKTPVVDVKKSTLKKHKVQESRNTGLNSVKQKLKAPRTNHQELL